MPIMTISLKSISMSSVYLLFREFQLIMFFLFDSGVSRPNFEVIHINERQVVLIFDGWRFIHSKMYTNSTYWRCEHFKSQW